MGLELSVLNGADLQDAGCPRHPRVTVGHLTATALDSIQQVGQGRCLDGPHARIAGPLEGRRDRRNLRLQGLDLRVDRSHDVHDAPLLGKGRERDPQRQEVGWLDPLSATTHAGRQVLEVIPEIRSGGQESEVTREEGGAARERRKFLRREGIPEVSRRHRNRTFKRLQSAVHDLPGTNQVKRLVLGLRASNRLPIEESAASIQDPDYRVLATVTDIDGFQIESHYVAEGRTPPLRHRAPRSRRRRGARTSAARPRCGRPARRRTP